MNVPIPWLTAALAADAAGGDSVVQLELHPLEPTARVVAPAFVVEASPDDNKAILLARDAAPTGAIIVLCGHAGARSATIGDIIVTELLLRGIAGLVTDGLIRDSAQIRDLHFPVWCRGKTPIAPRQLLPGRIGGCIELGNVSIGDGDLVIADDDGIVVWPRDRVDGLLERAKARLASDNERLSRLRTTTLRAAPR